MHAYIRPSQSGGGGGGGRVYEIKTLRSNLAPEEEEGVYSRGEYNRASTDMITRCACVRTYVRCRMSGGTARCPR